MDSWIQAIDPKCEPISPGQIFVSCMTVSCSTQTQRRSTQAAEALLHALLRSAFIAHPKKPVLENTLFFRGHNISAPPVFESSLCLSWSPRRPWLLCGVPRRGSGRRSPCRRRLQGCRCRRCRTAAIDGAPSIAGLQVASPLPPLLPWLHRCAL